MMAEQTERQGSGKSPVAEARDIARTVKDASTSFYWAMRLLPKPQREAMFAVYSFCRKVDDIADSETLSPDEKRKQLDAWRKEVDALYAGQPSWPETRALEQPLKDFSLRRDDFMEVIAGMEMDVGEPVVAPDMKTFDLYVDRVACAVGRLCVCVFGDPSEHGVDVAHHTGRALQITNILRDVDEDAGIGRVYLPRELMEKHGLDWSEPKTLTSQDGYVAMWRELAEIARQEYDFADDAMALCRKDVMRPARIMKSVYQRNLERMMALPDAALADSSVSKRLVGGKEKLLIALRHGFF
ncbi:MAG: presqualene diphosphate synthase HpnD [Anderseniella sp.]|jgi:phytoene synthase|nr:presqualene diphosphate synthase HpnD [Anderseniella sp.]